MRAMILCLLMVSSLAYGQTLKGGYRSTLSDTATYIIRLRSENPFMIDSVSSASSGKRLNFYLVENPDKSCNSIICSDTGEVILGFRELNQMRPLQGERRIKLNSQIQTTSDYQKGVVVYTRHGKKLHNISVATFTEVAPGDPGLQPTVVRPNPGK